MYCPHCSWRNIPVKIIERLWQIFWFWEFLKFTLCNVIIQVCLLPSLSVSACLCWTCWDIQGQSAAPGGGMDPLGARSQFVDIQTLPTWQLAEGSKETPLEQSDSLAFPSPFPFRPDINCKILLLWVQLSWLHVRAVGWKSLLFSLSDFSLWVFLLHLETAERM